MARVYSNSKIFHFKEKLDSLPREVPLILPPVHIRLKPTNVCNHRCHYCAYREEDLQLGRDMQVKDFIPREKMLEIVEDIIAMGVKAVTFSGGGEPFCYPYLLEAAQKLAASPVKFASLTNGSRLCGPVAEVFALNASWVRVSIDGWDGPSYARYRGVGEDEFSTVLKNIRAFKRFGGRCVLGAVVIIDKDNSPHLVDLVRQLRDHGADNVKLSGCIISNDWQESNAYHRPFFQTTKEQIQQIKSSLSDDHFEVFDAYHEMSGKFDKDYSWCPFLQVLAVIGADQRVYSCQDKAYNLAEGLIGSIRDVRFRDFWLSDKNKFFHIDPSRLCQHHCVANLKNQAILDYLSADKEHLAFV